MSIKLPTLDRMKAMLRSDRKVSPTIVRDALGNAMRPGMPVFWLKAGLIAWCKEIVQGGIIPGPDLPPTPAEFVIEIRFPLNTKDRSEFVLGEFIAVKNPKEVESAQIPGERTEEDSSRQGNER